MATGRGKSLIFQLHAARRALHAGSASVFVYPLRALVADQAFSLSERFVDAGLTVRVVTGESSPGERDKAFVSLEDGSLDVVLTTPEFLEAHAERFAASRRVGFVVVDEAHHVGQSRASHRPTYGRLGDVLERLGNPQVFATTATCSAEAAEACMRVLGVERTVLDPTVRENLALVDRRGASDRDGTLAALISNGDKTIVYVNSREQSVRIARDLRKRVPSLGMRIAFYNGGLTKSSRHAVERAFRGGDLTVVVSTSAFGEGVNIPDVRNVVLYHLPFNDVEFNQMCGRAGRDGQRSQVHLLFGAKDARINDLVLSSQAPERDDLAALYLALRDAQGQSAEPIEITNAELVERARSKRREFSLDERGVSAGIGIMRELEIVTSEGRGAYRRLSVPRANGVKVELDQSVRYAEGREEIAEFGEFRDWVLSAEPDELLARFNRPILPE
jgi:single-stranded-DNA-specific exonuclease